jgi:hypothetical protein
MPTLSEDDGFGLDARSLGIIERVARRVLETMLPAAAKPRNGRHFSQNCFLAKAGGSGVPARSGTTPGSGTVTMWKCDDTTLEATSVEVTAWNLSESAVADDAYLMLVRIGNKLWVIWEDCS